VRAVVIAVLVAACGHPPEPAPVTTPPPPAIDARVIDAAPDAPPDAPPRDAAVAQERPDALVVPVPELRSCPKTYAALATAGCALADADKLTCKYPDGHCECVMVVPCAGWAGAYEEARKHPRAFWSCTPRVREDGCPGDAPKIGSRCTKDGQECMFGSCGGEVMVCRSGTWAVEHMIGPPPAAPPQR
jgi:hypothetical protein